MATAASPPPIAQKTAAPMRPSLCIKPSPASPSPSPHPTSATTPSSLMSKEWVVPPRPKPGRKPATDTPPTKRKAQNRAAQRAFRERRAARVGELEEQMKQVEEENERVQDSLRETVRQLEVEVENYQIELAKWIERCRVLEKDLAHHHGSHNPTDAVPLPRRTNINSNEAPQTSTDIPMGCGNCSLETSCQCLDDAFDTMNETSAQPESNMQEKRPHSPQVPEKAKRIKVEPNEILEIDFTALYALRAAAQPLRQEVVSPTSATADRCGFCQDGTPCICAEMAAEADEQQQAADTLQIVTNNRTLRRMNQLSQYTPPPSEGDVSSAPPQSLANPCASGPGTCAQCRADPNSTLFCKSLAASRSLGAVSQGGCSSGKTAGGACCQAANTSTAPPTSTSTRSLRPKSSNINTKPAASTATTRQGQPVPSITLTCADAYTTLSRHPSFTLASSEMASWIPRLRPNDTQQGPAKAVVGPAARGVGVEIETRPAMEIDAANVMAVLKEFDRRFRAN